MMTHQQPPELTGVDFPGIDPKERETIDDLLVKTALDNGSMNDNQLDDCRREKEVMETLGARQTISQICVRKGYLSKGQVEEAMRKHHYEKIRKEDLEIGRAAVQQQYVSLEQVRMCLNIQEQAYAGGRKSIPRLMKLMGDRGLLDGKKAMALLDALYQVDRRGEAEIREEKVEQWAWDRSVRRTQEPRRQVTREAERFSVPDAYVRYRLGLIDPFREDSELTPLINISTTGAQFLTKEKLKIGQKLRLKILVPAFSDNLYVKSHVCWIGRAGLTALYRTGIRFVGLNRGISTCLKQLDEDPFLRSTGRSPYRVYW